MGPLGGEVGSNRRDRSFVPGRHAQGQRPTVGRVIPRSLEGIALESGHKLVRATFPRSAWECSPDAPRRLRALCYRSKADAERPRRHSHEGLWEQDWSGGWENCSTKNVGMKLRQWAGPIGISRTTLKLLADLSDNWCEAGCVGCADRDKGSGGCSIGSGGAGL